MRNNQIYAFYLPQYHPIPENDKFWGKGFTEWTNVAKAKPLFKGHVQPRIPADLGFYDLRVAETRRAQAKMARQSGVAGFIWYHYWFAGKKILEQPLELTLQDQEYDFPFAMCWANQTWSGVWHGAKDRILIEQTYPGDSDHIDHFTALLPMFRDPRYIKVSGRLLFLIFQPNEIPDLAKFVSLWNRLAIENGLPCFYFVAFTWNLNWMYRDFGLDGSLPQLPLRLKRAEKTDVIPALYDFKSIYKHCIPPYEVGMERYPCLVPNWDNTPRSGSNGVVFLNATPDLFADQLRLADNLCEFLEHPLIFIKAWNEWAEGNFLEPDLDMGTAYLDTLRRFTESRSIS